MNTNNQQILEELQEKKQSCYKWLVISSINIIGSFFYGLYVGLVIWLIKGFITKEFWPWDDNITGSGGKGDYGFWVINGFIWAFVVTFLISFIAFLVFFIRLLLISREISERERERERDEITKRRPRFSIFWYIFPGYIYKTLKEQSQKEWDLKYL